MSTIMPIHRRGFLQLAGSAAALGMSGSGAAIAQGAYPSKPVRFIVGFPAAGPNDVLARLMAEWLTAKLGQPFVVENQPGKAGNIATEAVARAPADGHTILLCGPANAIGAALYPDLPFNFLRDFAPVGGITREALVMVVNPSLPVTNAAEYLAYARANPGKLKMASTGNGSAPHVTAELFRMLTGVETNIVHYAGGGAALKAIIAGEAQVMFEPMSASIEPVRKGQLRAVAVTTTARSAALPNVPPLAETVPGYEASATTGVAVPKGTPRAVVELLNRTMNAAFSDAGMRAKLLDTGGEPLPGSPEDFTKVMEGETAKWGDVVKRSGAKAE